MAVCLAPTARLLFECRWYFLVLVGVCVCPVRTECGHARGGQDLHPIFLNRENTVCCSERDGLVALGDTVERILLDKAVRVEAIS